ncbi:protein-L-isoaspartate(D-aspartate) O-methyltransferase [Streptomyces sp. NPDC101150]|uniref:protein-L-isoaspartate(D-aspartate) O-methyltransferase n=1 Tax=Streptomyces sp. NPDC101150 TaxID=3366114 RepID=UPI0037FD171B
MTDDADQERPRLDGLGRVLMSSGALSSDWAPTYAAVPRSTVLPDLMWPFDMEAGRSLAVSKADDPARWQEFADSDVPIVTQWDDGRHTGTEPGRVPTSSASMPSVVFRMLQALDLRPGHRALEIGTATLWNALLMAHRAGPGNVTTMEVDGALAASAGATAERFGNSVRVIHGDGSQGYPEGAPYARVIATCGLRSLPFAWVGQCEPGGIIVVPWGTHYSNGDAVARLVVAADGRSASGRFTGPVEFMKLRAQRAMPVIHSDYVPGSVADGDETATTITESEFVGGQFTPQRFALGLRMPNCLLAVAEKRDGGRPVWLYGMTDRSWACAWFRDGDTARVWQSGPRRLWDEAEAAYRWWEENSKPGHERFGLTVTAEGQSAWLDDPADSWTV